MKKLQISFWALLCLILIKTELISQTHPAEARFIEAMEDLDMTEIQNSTNIFYDRVPGYIPIHLFDGIALDDSIVGSASAFELMYTTMHKSYLSNSPLLEKDSLDDLIDLYSGGDTIVLTSIIYQYERLKLSAMDDGLIYYDSVRFQHSPGVTDSPYIRDTVIMSGPLQKNVEGQNQVFILPSELFVSNLESTINVEIDFGNGNGYQSVAFDTPINVYFPTADTFRLNLKYQIGNSEYRHSSSFLEITSVQSFKDSNNGASDRNGPGFCDVPDRSETVVENGQTAFVRIWYNKACDDDKIRKPLIIIKGFDPNNSITSDYVINGNDGLLDESYGLGQAIKKYIHDEEFDLFFIELENTTALIQQSAGVIKKSIEWINEWKNINGSSEENVVIGASLGGIFGKWALREFEMNGEDHETELYISYDTPFRGANIPLALQGLVNSFGTYEIPFVGQIKSRDTTLRDGFLALNSPAANQLIHYSLGNCTSGCIESDLKNDHDIFFSEFASRGNLEIPHIALSNGSINGDGQLFSAGEKILDKGVDLVTKLNQFIFNVVAFHIPSWPSDIRAELDGWALPGNDNGEVFKYKVKYYKFEIKIHTDKKTTSIAQPSQFVEWDSAPGGLRLFESEDTEEGEENFLYKSYCFIPTVSALDIDTNDPYFDVSDIESTLANEIPHIKAYAGATIPTVQFGSLQVNQEHVTLTNALASSFLGFTLNYNFSLSNLTQRTFNFGSGDYSASNPLNTILSTSHVINKNLNISDNGKLWINKNDKIGFTDMFNVMSSSEHFTVYIGSTYCDANPTTVTAKDRGEISIGEDDQKTGELIIDNTNKLVIDDKGVLKINDGSNLVVKDGASLYFKTGARVKLLGNSKILVEQGGKLIIESGATIILEDGINQGPGSNSRIEVEGEIIADGGVIEVGGEGYVWLKDESNIEVQNSSHLTFIGHGKDKISLYVDEWDLTANTGLNIDNAYVYIRTGNIYIDTSHDCLIKDSKLEGRGNDLFGSIVFNNVQQVQVLTSNWFDCTLSATSGDNILMIASTMEIQNKTRCIIAENLDHIVIRGTSFEANFPIVFLEPITRIAVSLSETPVAYFRNSNFSDFKSNQGVSKFLGESAAIYASSSSAITLNKSTINDCDLGIQTLLNSNVKMQFSDITTCAYGINQNSSFALTNPEQTSSLELICSELSDNLVGVKGHDILLSIDGPINSQSTDGEIRPNTFVNNNSDFFIQYIYIDPEFTNLQARFNKWNSLDNYSLFRFVGTESQFYTLDQSNPVKGDINCIPFLTGPTIPNECNYDANLFPLNNSTGYVIPVSEFCFGEIPCNSTYNIQQLYWEAFKAIYNEDMDCAMKRYKSVAEYKYSSDYETLGSACKHQIAIANAYVNVHNNANNDTIQSELVIEQSCVEELQPGTVSEAYVFVLDASGSINSVEFNKMRATVKKILEEYSTIGININYSVIQFASDTDQDLSIPYTNDISLVDYLVRAFYGGTNVTNGVEYAEDYISQINDDSRMLLFTDATKAQGNGLLAYTNTIKPNRDITIVRYQDGNVNEDEFNSFYAAASSKGGTYFGNVDANSGDPQGEGAPRKFIMGDFAGTFASIIDPVILNTTCDYLSITTNTYCTNAIYNWTSSNGGVILSDSMDVSVIRTNGIGTYTLEVICDPNSCVLTLDYSFEVESGVEARQSSIASTTKFSSRAKILKNGEIERPIDREVDTKVSNKVMRTSQLTLSIMPNPSNGLIYIDGIVSEAKYKIVDLNGRVLLEGLTTNNETIDLTRLNAGVYIIEVFSQNQLFSEKIIIQ